MAGAARAVVPWWCMPRAATFFALLTLALGCSTARTSGAPDAASGAGGGSGGATAGGQGEHDAGVGGLAVTGGSGGASGRAGATDARLDAPGDRAGDRGAGDATTGGAPCKRGIATNTAPGAAFSPSVSWWYDWSPRVAGAGSPLEFDPMIWGAIDLTATLPSLTYYLLGFNEPNFHAQSNLTAQQAAADWPMLEAKASASGAALVSPAVNYCGPATSCNGTSPYQYLRDFFAACAGCRVDHIAVHWYNCDLPWLMNFLEPGGSLEGFEQFSKRIWLTEFSCDGTKTAADQEERCMRAAIPYLKRYPHVFRYSWFSADPIPNARLMNSDGSPTALGQIWHRPARRLSLITARAQPTILFHSRSPLPSAGEG